MSQKRSNISGFYKLSYEDRVKVVSEFSGLNGEDVAWLKKGAPEMEDVEHMSENIIGTIGIPFGVATNFLINGKDYLVPMATEESSVVAAASHGAKIARVKGGFTATTTGSFMMVEIQVVDIDDPEVSKQRVLAEKEELLTMADTRSNTLPKLGAGAKDLEAEIFEGFYGSMVVFRLVVDVRDAMGANVMNTMAEYIAPKIAELAGGRVCLRVVDNYAIRRLAKATCVAGKEAIGGEDIIDNLLQGYSCAYFNQHRATGHNKGAMNGITAVVLATGNDTRAMESGFHSYAARCGRYRALPVWEKNKDGDLVGTLEMPVQVGIIGGMTKLHPVARTAIKILGVKSADELGQVLASVGLASKLAAERALAAEGIQDGHMRLHAGNIAMMAGAVGKEVEIIKEKLCVLKQVNLKTAQDELAKIKG
ncbi:MAG: hydroxymethylglutaryl-CoA reductase, degradative [Candidatus Omnitrophica bacterium]|nr:hydroxymethylglutaryl-CoA reductase, degradative [Candidatus Omnitrophota bacterium]MBU1128579.1 hydroxymethylglutaryl-CoA reductase, degradative [Candidatus Omnitrophota bacterium]MBU1784792.1 hydroxymethylglutaryl-CoA reductase, degradative [Candidatus Omnitrophota bacterium]MBU1851583.1 hydroxymethylglutaryl-CoA reductase, degradative [Candidatus Omnitrophota bacterium]